jgi:hypothetical protein
MQCVQWQCVASILLLLLLLLLLLPALLLLLLLLLPVLLLLLLVVESNKGVYVEISLLLPGLLSITMRCRLHFCFCGAVVGLQPAGCCFVQWHAHWHLTVFPQ